MSAGKWTVYCCDTFDGTRWSEKFDTEADARAYANRTAGTMLTCHIDSPRGQLVAKKGSY